MNEDHAVTIQFVEDQILVHHSDLQNYLEGSFDLKSSEAMQIISECVQESKIRRYEYILGDESMRRIFYMPINSRLML